MESRKGGEPDLSVIGRLFSEPARARALVALMDGRHLPATTLATEAGVAPSTMSAHLAKLTDGGFLTVRIHGRHRYYTLANPEIAELIERIARLAPTTRITSLTDDIQADALRNARRCYSHLGGRLAVGITETMVARGHLEVPTTVNGDGDSIEAMTLTRRGAQFLTNVDVRLRENMPVRCCIDWTERRPHTNGPLGRALFTEFHARKWIKTSTSTRAIRITELGEARLEELFEISTLGITR
ncbi:metalloregulator ArsR/SmtB family transcription factor [Microbacterium sp. X-17]|uniref:ArsR/SmtB family transcription factor n=1 Tax=Microbacterium sp. X-17 TaxID=3144404 RepID=UPI0031F553FB